jgi:hypothetical protein
MFTIQTVTNLQWCNVEKTFFSCNVKYEEFSEVHPTGVNATDEYAHIKELWEKGNAGVYGEIADYAPAEIIYPQHYPQPEETGTQTL